MEDVAWANAVAEYRGLQIFGKQLRVTRFCRVGGGRALVQVANWAPPGASRFPDGYNNVVEFTEGPNRWAWTISLEHVPRRPGGYSERRGRTWAEVGGRWTVVGGDGPW